MTDDVTGKTRQASTKVQDRKFILSELPSIRTIEEVFILYGDPCQASILSYCNSLQGDSTLTARAMEADTQRSRSELAHNLTVSLCQSGYVYSGQG